MFVLPLEDSGLQLFALELRVEQGSQIRLECVARLTGRGGHVLVFHDGTNGNQAFSQGLVANGFAGVVRVPALAWNLERLLAQIRSVAEALLVAALRGL
ncbi:hypothetical protein D9M71_500810 [compost metagenome]